MAIRVSFGIPGLLLAIAVAVCAVPAASRADEYRVVNVDRGDSLNVRAGPAVGFPVIGRLPHNARGIRMLRACVGTWCPISKGSVIGWANMRFLAPDTGSAEAGPETTAVPTRRVLPDGTLELRFADGTLRHRLPDGKLEIVRPDGTKSTFTFLQTPGADLPPLPSEFSEWGTRVNDNLLAILTNILSADELTAYKQTEEGKDFYSVMNWRLRSLEFLTVPAS